MRYELKNLSKWCGPYNWGCSGELSEKKTVHEDSEREVAFDLDVAVDVAKNYLDAPDEPFDEATARKNFEESAVEFMSEELFKKAFAYYKWRAEKFVEAKAFLEAGQPGTWKVDIPEELNSFETGFGEDKLAKPRQMEAWISIVISKEEAK